MACLGLEGAPLPQGVILDVKSLPWFQEMIASGVRLEVGQTADWAAQEACEYSRARFVRAFDLPADASPPLEYMQVPLAHELCR